MIVSGDAAPVKPDSPSMYSVKSPITSDYVEGQFDLTTAIVYLGNFPMGTKH